MNRSLINIFLLSAMVVLSFNSFGQQSYHKSKNNYVVLTKNVEQLKPILQTAADLAREDGKNYGEFQVVICGKAVTELTDQQKMNSYLVLAKQYHVKMVACGVSLNKFHVKTKDLPIDITVVENGIKYDFNLQKKGFYSISL